MDALTRVRQYAETLRVEARLATDTTRQFELLGIANELTRIANSWNGEQNADS